MKYNVTEIEFDLDDDYDMTEEDKVKFNHQLELELHDLALGVWEADNEEDARLQFQNGNYQYYDISDFTDGHELIGVTEEVCDS